MSDGTHLQQGLASLFLDHTPREAAIRGEAVPDLSDDILVRCVVSGIRSHDGFASKLHGAGHPPITRALNARAIMSNRIPFMNGPEDIPYCFWYPEVPREETLRELLRQYPTPLTRYQVGRACAVAGYTALFVELELLPDVAIAEEARDCCNEQIFDLIMSQPTRYAVMDDYTRSVKESPTPGACLNGDTCVRRMLRRRQAVSDAHRIPYFDIAEDWNLDVSGSSIEDLPVPDEAIELLHTPLPFDLPNIDKDFLILMAAWGGNIERYSRLRRPAMINGEIECIVRGIYHDTFFAKWCSKQPQLSSLRKYVYARFTMNNDISWATDEVPDTDLPELIHFPQRACWEIYEELHRRKPAMRQTIACALIACDAPGPFFRIDPTVEPGVYSAACRAENKGFLAHLEHVADEQRIDIQAMDLLPTDPNLTLIEGERLIPPAKLQRHITIDTIGFVKDAYFESGAQYESMSNVLLYVSAKPSIPTGFDFAKLRERYADAVWVSEEERKSVGLYRFCDDPRRTRAAGWPRWENPL